jgi:hypothetical protein
MLLMNRDLVGQKKLSYNPARDIGPNRRKNWDTNFEPPFGSQAEVYRIAEVEKREQSERLVRIVRPDC